MAFSAYHFARPDKTAGDAVAEADWFVANAQLTGKNMVPVLDLEDSGGLGATKLKQWAKAWLNEVQARLGVKATIYTSPSFWQTHLADTRWFADNGYRLWVAHWTSSRAAVSAGGQLGRPRLDDVAVRQLRRGRGIKGCVDLDRFNGTSLAPLKIKNNR